MDVVIFGAGDVGREAFRFYRLKGDKVIFFIDNNERLWGKNITIDDEEIEVVSLNYYIVNRLQYEIIIAGQYKSQAEIEKQLVAGGLNNYSIFDLTALFRYGRITSYSDPRDIEDVILWHLFKEDEEIFYIDVGSNDPFRGSVTKLFYDNKNANGINIEPQPYLIEVTNAERPRDINICAICAREDGKKTELFLQGGGSTVKEDYSVMKQGQVIMTNTVTLKCICDSYIKDNQKINFLKIDAEGSEREVLLGADFSKYRPEVLVIESTYPRTEIPSFEEWEDILIANKYNYMFSYGINRYYVSDESEGKFKNIIVDISNIKQNYNIYHAGLSYLK